MLNLKILCGVFVMSKYPQKSQQRYFIDNIRNSDLTYMSRALIRKSGFETGLISVEGGGGCGSAAAPPADIHFRRDSLSLAPGFHGLVNADTAVVDSILVYWKFPSRG